MIRMLGKPTDELASYRHILFPLLSKVFEQVLIKQIQVIIENSKVITCYEFGNKSGTVEQIDKIVNKVNRDLENERYCSPDSLDIK